jgi:hypothetical protein
MRFCLFPEMLPSCRSMSAARIPLFLSADSPPLINRLTYRSCIWTCPTVRLLSDTIDRDRYPLSPRILTLKSIFSKIEPQHHPSPGCERAPRRRILAPGLAVPLHRSSLTSGVVAGRRDRPDGRRVDRLAAGLALSSVVRGKRPRGGGGNFYLEQLVSQMVSLA